MEANFQRVLPLVLKHEGGFVNHPSDPGGATNKGITIATMRRYIDRSATVDDLKRITDAQVAKVYRKHYWDKVRGDDLPSGVDYAVFDFAVNSGPTRAAKYLQSLLLVKVDGIIGPQTIAAAKRANAAQVIEALCDNRMAFLQRLKHWPTFKKGWTRRVDDVRSHSLTLSAKEAHPEPKAPPEVSERPREAEPAPAATHGRKTTVIAAAVAALAAGAAYIANLPCQWLGVFCGG